MEALAEDNKNVRGGRPSIYPRTARCWLSLRCVIKSAPVHLRKLWKRPTADTAGCSRT